MHPAQSDFATSHQPARITFLGMPIIRPVNPDPDSVGKTQERTPTAVVTMTVYEPDLRTSLSSLPPNGRLTRLIGYFVPQCANASHDPDSVLRMPVIRMLEHHKVLPIKGSRQFQIIFTILEAVNVFQLAGTITFGQTNIFKIKVCPEEPSQQVLETCRVLEALPSGVAIAASFCPSQSAVLTTGNRLDLVVTAKSISATSKTAKHIW